MKRLKGIIPVLITPFNEDQTLDENSLVKVTEHVLENNPGGLWVLGTGGEDMNLSFNERIKVAEIVTNTVDNKVPIILGCGFYSKTDTKNYINETQKLNFECYHLMPYHTLMSLNRYYEMYLEIAEFSQKPLWMYTSANYCRNFPPDFIKDLKNHPNIAGIKFSTSNIVQIEKALSYSSQDFQVITAVVRQFLASLSMGVEATTTVEGCFYFEKIYKIYEAFLNNNYSGARRFQLNLNRFLEQVTTDAGKENFLKSAEGKYYLSKKGICKEYMSGYYRHVNKSEKKYLDSFFEKY